MNLPLLFYFPSVTPPAEEPLGETPIDVVTCTAVLQLYISFTCVMPCLTC